MADNIADVLQELSGILRRISEQRNEHIKPQVDEIGADTLKGIELLARGNDETVRENDGCRAGVMQTLRHQNHLLECLIARLQEKTEKGRE
jgi:hypothetical protein